MIQVYCDDPEKTSLEFCRGIPSIGTCRLWPRKDLVLYVKVFLSKEFNLVNKKEAQLHELSDVVIQFNRM